MGILRPVFWFFALGALFAPASVFAQSASLYLRPGSGTFTVGSTFEVGIYLNTNGASVNAVGVDLSFPQDKLQVVSPTIGRSLVQFWVVQPTYSNSQGTISFKGGIPPPGISTTDGLVSTVVFRVINIGRATVAIRDSSAVFLADGLGTNILSSNSDAIFLLTLPPPEGPSVVTPKHPDPAKWYQDNDVEFVWEIPKGAASVSYVLNQDPVALPDDIPEGSKSSVLYNDLPSGRHYFHIKAFSPAGGWGGVSHSAVNIDSAPPAEFEVEISPGERTTARRPTVLFTTTDAHSGISHFTFKIIDLENGQNPMATRQSAPFFIEVSSPFVLQELEPGAYDVIVRAYDLAGNFRESQKRLTIAQGLFRNLGPEGVNLRSSLVVPWWGVYTGLGVLSLLALWLAHFAFRNHREVERKLALGILNLVEHRVSERLTILKQKREEFDKEKLNKPQP